MTKARMDLHAAVQHAKRATEIEPRNADYKITLAAVFIEAGLALNARRELEAAAQLSPRNATIQALLKTVNKAGWEPQPTHATNPALGDAIRRAID
jgi:thioredoxin-like negative regulator of GroEL